MEFELQLEAESSVIEGTQNIEEITTEVITTEATTA